jgi:prophage DNA circulation protein
MTWRDNLLEAKLDGFPIKIGAVDFQEGNNVVVHEFPYRNKVVVDNLGNKAKTLSITVYFDSNESNGFNYLAEANNFRAILHDNDEDKELVHPTDGIIYGKISDVSQTIDTSQQGGLSIIQFTFHVNGGIDYDVVSIDTGDLVNDAVGDAYDSIENDFVENFDTENYQDFVLNDAVKLISKARETIRTANKYASIAAQIADGNLNTLLGSGELGQALGITQAQSLASSFVSLVKEAQQVDDLLKFDVILNGKKTKARKQQDLNSLSIQSLVQTASIVRYAHLESDFNGDLRYDAGSTITMGTPKLLTIAEANYRIYKVFNLLDSEIERLSNSGQFDDTQAALQTLKSVVIQRMKALSENSLRTFYTNCCDGTHVNGIMPSAVIAYRFYENLSDDAIIARNNIENPCLVPKNALLELVDYDN